MSKKSVSREVRAPNERQRLLSTLVEEVQEPSAVTLLLVEQMADALYWARQHAIDKELIILRGMQKAFDRAGIGFDESSFAELREALEQGNGSKAYSYLETRIIREVGLTIADLRARSIMDNMKLVSQADELIQRQVRNIRGLQKCIDSIDFKKRLVKKMDLELSRLEADVSKISGKRDG